MSELNDAQRAKGFTKLLQYLHTYNLRLPESPEEREKELDEFMKTGKLKRVRTMGR